MDWTVNELAKIFNSTKNCDHCKAIFPTEYDKCPGCEVDKLWKKVNDKIGLNSAPTDDIHKNAIIKLRDMGIQ